MIKNVIKAIKEFIKSKNKIYIIIKYKIYISGFFAFLTIVLGSIGFFVKGDNFIISFFNSINLFTLSFPKEANEFNAWIIIASITAIITIFFTVITLFIKDNLNDRQKQKVSNKEHIAVFGLGEVALSFLKSYTSENRKDRIAIIESDSNNKKLEEYKKEGFAVFIGDSLSNETLELLNFNTMKYALIALGSDRVNIELAEKIIKIYNEKNYKTSIKLIIHIQNKDLDILFHQKFMLQHNSQNGRLNNNKIDVKIFSFFNEAAEDLFENHLVDGDSITYSRTNKDFHSILIGNGEFIKNVIYQIALVSHLPNENIHTVHIVDKDADNLLIEIKKYIHYNSKKIPTFKIKAINLERNSLAFFKHRIWDQKDLVNVIIAYDAEVENLDLAVELFNRTFLSKVKSQDMPKIIFALYDQTLLSKIINDNEESFKHFYTFGNSEKVLSYANLIEEENDLLAKLIHFGYGDKYIPNELHKYKTEKRVKKSWLKEISIYFNHKYTEIKDPINVKWFNSAKYSDKLSSIAQAKHINMKLKAMGFMKKPSKKDTRLLLKENRDRVLEVFKSERELIEINEKQLIEYSKELNKYYNGDSFDIKYFPEAYTTLFEKMIRMEHNRWSAYHYLNGWEYSKVKIKENKEHDCLKSLDYFKKDNLKITVIYDIYSFLYLPNYLAEAGYEIVELHKSIRKKI